MNKAEMADRLAARTGLKMVGARDAVDGGRRSVIVPSARGIVRLAAEFAARR